MPKSKGPEWDQVIILEPEGNNRAGVCKVQCKHCLHEFWGGASRIRDHFVYSTPGCGMIKCEKVPAEVPGVMQGEHGKKVQRDQEAARKRAGEGV